jgi:hypothetical protein
VSSCPNARSFGFVSAAGGVVNSNPSRASLDCAESCGAQHQTWPPAIMRVRC